MKTLLLAGVIYSLFVLQHVLSSNSTNTDEIREVAEFALKTFKKDHHMLDKFEIVDILDSSVKNETNVEYEVSMTLRPENTTSTPITNGTAVVQKANDDEKVMKLVMFEVRTILCNKESKNSTSPANATSNVCA